MKNLLEVTGTERGWEVLHYMIPKLIDSDVKFDVYLH